MALQKHFLPLRNVDRPLRCILRSTSSQHPSCSHQPPPYDGRISFDSAVKLRKEFVNTASAPYYSKPLMLHHGNMQWLWDIDGRRYLDLFAGIVTVSVGHCHPKVVEAANHQMKNLWHTSNIYMYPSILEYAEKLKSTLPAPLTNCFFVNSGSEANDLALLMARLYTGKFEIVSLQNAYHGASPMLMGVTAQSSWRYNTPTGFGCLQTMLPDPYRGPWGGNRCRDSPVQTTRGCDCSPGECQACNQYVDRLKETALYSGAKQGLAGIFIESIQGVGGAVQFPRNFVKESFEFIRSVGGVCISDEVQTGFGRTGTHFWGFEGHGVTPDIVTMAKGMGNGFPMAAVVTTPEIAKTLSQALYFNTYSGNPVAGAIGSAVLEVIEEEKMQENSHNLGTYFLKNLAQLRDKSTIVGDVRGKGLMIGVEMVSDKRKRSPLDGPKMMQIIDGCKERGLLIGRGGIFGSVLRIKPPMCITKEDVDFALSVLEEVLQKTEKGV